MNKAEKLEMLEQHRALLTDNAADFLKLDNPDGDSWYEVCAADGQLFDINLYINEDGSVSIAAYVVEKVWGVKHTDTSVFINLLA